MTIYLRFILVATYLAASLGIIVPALISASDDILVLAGFAYLASIPVVLYYTNRNLIKKIKEYFNAV